MSDLFGHVELTTPFQDIRNQRDTVAEEKAVLCLQLKELCHKCPQSVANGSIQITRSWFASQKNSLKTLNSSRSSVPDLQRAVTNMRQYL